jgi:hypothetical protein
MISLFPVIGEWYDILTLVEWVDPVTEEKLTQLEKSLTLVWLMSWLWSGKLTIEWFNKLLKEMSDELWIAVEELLSISNRVVLVEYWSIKTVKWFVDNVEKYTPTIPYR